MKIVADSHIPYIKEYFSAYGELVLKSGRTINRADVKTADILLVRSITHVDKNLLEGSAVKFVGSVTAGADHLDMAWLDAAGICWCVAAGFNAPPVADYVVSCVAALEKKNLLKPGAKAAVIGVGNVGRLVVARLKLLGFNVVLSDPFLALSDSNFVSVPLEALSEVDLISLHVPLSRTGDNPTYHFINKSVLSRQKSGCVLLNASRGAVIDSAEILQYGKHLHWCFDVWEHEPHIDKAVLQQALIATPHIAGYSVQSKMRGIDMIYRIAQEKKIIPIKSIEPLMLPTQQLVFAGENHQWQDVVLGVFNPLIITEMLRTAILSSTGDGAHFDEMRNQFNYRHEFGATRLLGVHTDNRQQLILRRLGLQIIR